MNPIIEVMARAPAFPSAQDAIVDEYRTGGHAGLTKREYFAAMVLQGLLARPIERGFPLSINERAYEALMYADALVAALEKQP